MGRDWSGWRRSGGDKEKLGRYRSRVGDETAAETGKDKSGELDGYLMAHRGGEAGEKHSGEELGEKSRSSCESRDRKKASLGSGTGLGLGLAASGCLRHQNSASGKAASVTREQAAENGGAGDANGQQLKVSALYSIPFGRIDTIARG